jgi:hypothetical protein
MRNASFDFVRHKKANETVLCNPGSKASAVATLDSAEPLFQNSANGRWSVRRDLTRANIP